MLNTKIALASLAFSLMSGVAVAGSPSGFYAGLDLNRVLLDKDISFIEDRHANGVSGVVGYQVTPFISGELSLGRDKGARIAGTRLESTSAVASIVLTHPTLIDSVTHSVDPYVRLGYGRVENRSSLIRHNSEVPVAGVGFRMPLPNLPGFEGRMELKQLGTGSESMRSLSAGVLYHF